MHCIYSGFILTLAARVWKQLGNLGTMFLNSWFHCYYANQIGNFLNENYKFVLEVRFQICELHFQLPTSKFKINQEEVVSWLITKFFVLQSNLDYPDLDYLDFFLWSQFFNEYYIVVILKTQSRKKPNNPFKRLLKQRIILCVFQSSQVRWDKEIFWCVQLISDWLNCFVTKGISCLISSFRVGYVNRRTINRKLKSKTCLPSESEPFYWSISDIWKNKDKILKFTDSIKTSEGLKRKSLKLADDEQLDKALYAWFIQQRSTGTPISGLLLQKKVKHSLRS